jgi:hypothetical protein
MKRYTLRLFAIIAIVALGGCDKASLDCGPDDYVRTLITSDVFFENPSDYYWGLSGNTRYYTYNWTMSNICTKSNPKISLYLYLYRSNTSLTNPFSIYGAGISTCLGVQPQHVTLTTTDQVDYKSSPAEIGMQQCFSGQASASVYPYLTVSFTSLGSSQADSAYLCQYVISMAANMDYKKPQ